MSVATELALKESAEATFDASGTARCRFSPTSPGEYWVIEQYSVQTSGSGERRAWVYRNSEDGAPLDFTRQGNGDASFIGSIRLAVGEEIIFVWRDGAVGETARARVEGKRVIPGRRYG